MRPTTGTALRTLARSLAAAILLAAAITSPSLGQEPTATSTRRGWVIGPLVGLPTVGREFEPSLVTVGVTATRLAPNRPGLDVAFLTMPRAAAEGLFVLQGRVGVAIPIALSRDAFLVPSLGAHGIGAVGVGAGATGGYYGGLAMLFGGRSVGVRVGITWLRVPDFDETISHPELGVVRMPAMRVR
jgi:hypothetical protein